MKKKDDLTALLDAGYEIVLGRKLRLDNQPYYVYAEGQDQSHCSGKTLAEAIKEVRKILLDG